ncbi:MAG: Gfo/Idh/MocA family oxidoreductase, partial [Verrucomicrobiota bacterium]
MNSVVTFALLGAGDRGHTVSNWVVEHPFLVKIVAVAEPNDALRERIARAHDIPSSHQFKSWEQLLAQPQLADAVINTLMDQLHAPSATRAMKLGYHMMLEKPLATSLEDCLEIYRIQNESKRIVSVGHSLR